MTRRPDLPFPTVAPFLLTGMVGGRAWADAEQSGDLRWWLLNIVVLTVGPAAAWWVERRWRSPRVTVTEETNRMEAR